MATASHVACCPVSYAAAPVLCARAPMAKRATNSWKWTRAILSAASTGERPHCTVLCAQGRLITQAGRNADMEGYVPEEQYWAKTNLDEASVARCAVVGSVSSFPGVLQQLWMDASVRCPHAQRRASRRGPRVKALLYARWSSRQMADWAAGGHQVAVRLGDLGRGGWAV